MPLLIRGQRQRGIDKRHNLTKKVRRAAIADPLRIAAIGNEAGSLKGRHVTGHAGLAGTKFAHQFTNTMLAPIPHHPKGFEPDRLCESRKNCYRIHRFTQYLRLCAYPHIKAFRQLRKTLGKPCSRRYSRPLRPRLLNWLTARSKR